MATPDPLYGWFPGNQQMTAADRWMTIPERSSGPMIAGMLGFPEQRGPMSNMAFQLAGSPSMKPPKGTILPYSEYPSDDEAAGGGSPIPGDINSLNSLYKQGNKLYEGLLGSGTSAAGVADVAAGMAPADAAAYTSLFGGGTPASVFGGAAGAGGGALGATAAYDAMLAGAAPSAVFGGAGGGALTSTAAYDAMLAGGSPSAVFGGNVASGAGSGAAGASGGGGALAGSGISTALPLAAAGWAIADIANNSLVGHGDEKRNDSYFHSAFPETTELPLGRMGTYRILPDGRVLSANDYENLAGAFYGATVAPDGEPERWAAEYERLNESLQSTDRIRDWDWLLKNNSMLRGYTWDPVTRRLKKV